MRPSLDFRLFSAAAFAGSILNCLLPQADKKSQEEISKSIADLNLGINKRLDNIQQVKELNLKDALVNFRQGLKGYLRDGSNFDLLLGYQSEITGDATAEQLFYTIMQPLFN